jgi:hypothetical protein
MKAGNEGECVGTEALVTTDLSPQVNAMLQSVRKVTLNCTPAFGYVLYAAY